MSIGAWYRACTLLACGEGNKPLNSELIKKPHMEKFPTKYHVEVIWILHWMQCLIKSKLYHMMTWLCSTRILPAHKETTIQTFLLTPSTVRSTRNQIRWILSLKILSLVQSLAAYFIFSHSGSALSSVCKFTWPHIQQCIIDQMDLEKYTDWIDQIKGRGRRR